MSPPPPPYPPLQLLSRPDLELLPDTVSLALLRLAAWHTDAATDVDADEMLQALLCLEGQVQGGEGEGAGDNCEVLQAWLSLLGQVQGEGGRGGTGGDRGEEQSKHRRPQVRLLPVPRYPQWLRHVLRPLVFLLHCMHAASRPASPTPCFI